MNKMVKLFSVVMVLAMLVGLVTVLPAAAASQLANGDFSSDLEGWTAVKDSTRIVTENDEKFMEIYSKGNVESLSVAVEAGKPYVWTFDIRSAEESRVWVKWFNEDGVYLGDTHRLQSYISASSVWTEASVVGTAPKGVTATVDGQEGTHDAAYVTIVFNKYNSTGTVCIDNVTLRSLAEQTGELLPGGNLNAASIPTNIIIGDAAIASGTDARGGEGNALKIETSELETKTVSAYCYAAAGQKIDASVYMNLTALADGGSGVMLEVWDGSTLKGETSFFKAVQNSAGTALGWRKMMVPLSGLTKAAKLELRVTFTGQGTVLLDDFSAVTVSNDELVRNGDMEGLAGDFTPAWWESASAFKEYDSEDTVSHVYTAVEADTQNTYLGIHGTINNVSVKKSMTFTAGQRYKLQFDYKSDQDSWGTMFYVNGVSDQYIFPQKTTTETTSPWATQTYYFTVSEIKTSQALYFGRRSNGSLCCFDNISLTIADDADTLMFFDADGKTAETPEAGETYTAKYTGFGTDYINAENNRTIHLALASYRKEGNALVLDKVEIISGSAEMVPVKSNTVAAAVAGEVPLTISVSVKAEEGYTYKAIAWEEGQVLKPLTAAAELK